MFEPIQISIVLLPFSRADSDCAGNACATPSIKIELFSEL